VTPFLNSACGSHPDFGIFFGFMPVSKSFKNALNGDNSRKHEFITIIGRLEINAIVVLKKLNSI
jgi:hypothetical protein